MAQSVHLNNNTVTIDSIGTIESGGYIVPTRDYHAFCYFPESDITFTFALTATWYHLSNATNNLFANCELDGFTMSNDTLTITDKAGDYLFNATLNFTGTVNQTYKIRFWNVTKNAGVPIGGATDGSGTDIIQITLQAYGEDYDIGDELILQIQNADGSADAVFKSGNLFIKLLHE